VSKNASNFDVKSLVNLLKQGARYRVTLFIVFVGIIYGFVIYRMYTLSSPAADTSSVSNEVTSLTPHIDKAVAQRLQSLQDNSVNVRSLFDKARNNPFNE